jgi:hypothetical protein
VRSIVPAVVLCLMASTAVAQNWVNMLAQDPTGAMTTGHVCYTANGRDVTCDGGSPIITTSGTMAVPALATGGLTVVGSANMGNISATGNVSVTGNVSANKFIGDGSGLTGVAGASADRIVSGTTSMLAMGSSGFVSLTQAGTNTGWFDPSLGLVTIGVSSTGPISGTRLYSSGASTIAGTLNLGSYAAFTDGLGANWGGKEIVGGNGANQYLFFFTSNTEAMRIVSSGFVGIGTSAPSAKLDISGTYGTSGAGNQTISGFGVEGNLNAGGASVDTLYGVYLRPSITSQGGTGNKVIGLRVSPFTTDTGTVYSAIFDGGNVGIGNSAPTAPLEVSGTVSATQFAGKFVGDGSGLINVGGASADRIVSGTTSLLAISNTGYISITQAGTNTGWFDPTRGLVTIGVSSTGPISGTNGYYSGNVGIGIPPVANTPLWVSGATVFTNISQQVTFNTSIWQISRTATNGGAMVEFKSLDNNASRAIISASSPAPGGLFWVGSNGAVGIGTQAPSATLHVGGTAIISSWTTIGSNNPAADLLELDAPTGTGLTISGTSPRIRISRNGVSTITLAAAAGTGAYVPYAKTNDTVLLSSGGNLILTTNANSSNVLIGTNAVGSSATVFVSTGQVGINVPTPTVALEVSGTVSATQFVGAFVGDGSGLTNIAGASADRIVSGSTSMLAISTTGFISITQAATNTGWFDPTRGLVTIGVSSTGTISATKVYAGNFGTSGSIIYRDANGNLTANANIFAGSSGAVFGPTFTATGSGFFAATASGLSWGGGNDGIMGSAGQYIRMVTSGTEAMRIVSTGFVGIGTTAPTAKLEVSGTVSATHFVGDGSGLTNVGGDRITSGTLLAVANSATGYISLSTVSTTWAYLSSGVNYLPSLKTTTLSASTAIQVGSNSLTCGSGISGTMRYSQISSTMEYCNGTAWTSMGPSSTSPVAFQYNKGGTAQTVTTGANTKLTFSTRVLDTNNNFSACTTNCASGTQTATESRFTVTVPGKYLLHLQVRCATSAVCYATIFKNTSTYLAENFVYPGSGNIPVANASTIADLAVGDYVEGSTYSSSASIDGTAYYTFIEGVLLAPQGGGSGSTVTPGGVSSSVQFNSNGSSLSGDSTFTYASGTLVVSSVSASTVSASSVTMGYAIVTASFDGNGSVSCGAGKKILGGGCDCTGAGGAYVRMSYPSSNTTWRCYCDTGTSESAYAICANIN